MDPRDQFQRTECDCAACCVGCYTMPGFLVPGDAELIYESVIGADPWEHVKEFHSWMRDHLCASEGALVGIGGRWGRIPSLTPQQDEHGRCVFLTRAGQCSIHAVSPYGCSRCDSHQSAEEGKQRAATGVIACAKSEKYQDQVGMLHNAGLQAKPLLDRRRAYGKQEEDLELHEIKGDFGEA